MACPGYVISPAQGEGGEVLFQYDGTLDGLLTAIFDSYLHKPAPSAVVGGQYQLQLGARVKSIPSDPEKAERVAAGIRKRLGSEAYRQIWSAFLSCDPDKGNVIYRYVRLGMRIGPGIRQRLTDPRVMALDRISGLAPKEARYLLQFIRFARMENGVYYARITPDNDVLTLLMPDFADRYRAMPFFIHDVNRQAAGVYDTKEWYLISTEGFRLPDTAADERAFQQLWKRFYDAVAIRERVNPRLRRQHMPKRFWKNMVEMTLTDAAAPTLLPTDVSRAAVEAGVVTVPPVIPEGAGGCPAVLPEAANRAPSDGGAGIPREAGHAPDTAAEAAAVRVSPVVRP